jgi:hypothetical protein
MNVLSFVIVAVAVLLVMSAPHGEVPAKRLDENPQSGLSFDGGAN